ncbi:MAG: DUF2085 domain-containing protein [Anaerolineae bacterium]|nr:DUF2085 domain-containing protein [Anaerolineae bacterium]
MTTTQPALPPKKPRKRVFSLLVIAIAIPIFAAFLLITPEDLLAYTRDWFLAKTNMVGYAVCHQIEDHSFIIGGRALPLCARCTGTFIGALVGFFGQAVVLRRGRAVHFPSPLVIAILVFFMVLWAADGLNSLLATERLSVAIVALFNVRNLYEPQHWLRLATGALNGLAMSVLVYPALNVTIWRNPLPERAIRDLRDLGVLVLLEMSMVGLVLALVFVQWPWAIYPLALLGALGVLSLLTSVNTILVLIAVQRENAADKWHEAFIPVLAGFAVSIIQVIAISSMRYALTGTFLPLPLS